jgi:hypothetical protein
MSRSQEPHRSKFPKCKCGECRPAAMTRQGRPPCYECMLARNGKNTTELHHPFGRGNPDIDAITAETPGNWHRELDDRRARRPAILKRPGGNPLHQLAAVVATLGEAASALGEFARLQQWPEWVPVLCDIFSNAGQNAAEWLLILAGKLDDKYGPGWADEFGMPTWRP